MTAASTSASAWSPPASSRPVVRGIESDAVPRLVAALVQLGGRVYAVEPSRQTLEDRFLQLLGGHTGDTRDGYTHHSASDPA